MRWWCEAWVAALVLWVAPASAGSYSVKPVIVGLSDQRPATTLRVTNTQSQPISLQVATFAWSQHNGEDQLTETQAIIAMPPVFTLPPGKTQSLRVGLRGAKPGAAEQAFRLVLKEIPSAEQGRGLQLALNMSLPVFVKPSTKVEPELRWQLRRDEAGDLVLRVENHGGAHGKFSEWQLQRQGDTLANEAGLFYLLPGTRREWPVVASPALERGDVVDVVVVGSRRPARTQTTVR